MEERSTTITMKFHSEFDSILDREVTVTVIIQFCPWCGEAIGELMSDDVEVEGCK